jgi:hypothetical protein
MVDRCPEECAGKFTAGARRIGHKRRRAVSSPSTTLATQTPSIAVIDTIIRTEPSRRLTSGTPQPGLESYPRMVPPTPGVEGCSRDADARSCSRGNTGEAADEGLNVRFRHGSDVPT